MTPVTPPDLPPLHFDPTTDALIDPHPPRLSENWPRTAVLCFFHEVLAARHDQGSARRAGRLSRESGGNPVFVVEDPGGRPTAVLHPGVGAPAAAIALERVAAAGVDTVIVCGGAGSLVPTTLGHVIVPTSAVRDEGTSFHYAPATPTIDVDPTAVDVITGLLHERDIPHLTGPTWTTDAPYRETRTRVNARRAQGCLTVEMEVAALLAVARFRGIRLAAILYAGDDLSGSTWDPRAWTSTPVRPTLLTLAIDAAARLAAT